MRKGYEVARQLLAFGVDGIGKTERGNDDLRFKVRFAFSRGQRIGLTLYACISDL
jgi:hypothetical protein